MSYFSYYSLVIFIKQMANANPPWISQLTEQLRIIRLLGSDSYLPNDDYGFSKEELIQGGEGSMWMAGRVGGGNIL
jgi:hypothetical protein